LWMPLLLIPPLLLLLLLLLANVKGLDVADDEANVKAPVGLSSTGLVTVPGTAPKVGPASVAGMLALAPSSFLAAAPNVKPPLGVLVLPVPKPPNVETGFCAGVTSSMLVRFLRVSPPSFGGDESVRGLPVVLSSLSLSVPGKSPVPERADDPLVVLLPVLAPNINPVAAVVVVAVGAAEAPKTKDGAGVVLEAPVLASVFPVAPNVNPNVAGALVLVLVLILVLVVVSPLKPKVGLLDGAVAGA